MIFGMALGSSCSKISCCSGVRALPAALVFLMKCARGSGTASGGQVW